MTLPRRSPESICHAAKAIHSATERSAFLDESCGDNIQLRQQVEALLHKADDSIGFFDSPALELDATTPPRDPNATKGPPSVLETLGRTLPNLPRVSLREPSEENEGQIVQSRSAEIPRHSSRHRYQLQGEIARGGMGAIIRGRDTDLGRDLAIKVLLESHRDDPAVIQRFIEEAQISGQLQHPGIAPVYELGQFDDARPFFSMKLVKGKTLSALLAARQSPPEDRSKYLGIFVHVCQTLAYAHSRGVIHRDLKPSNIMVGAFGEVQVMDWGLAKVLSLIGTASNDKKRAALPEQSVIQTLRSSGSSDSSSELGSQTQIGSVMGTPAYMSPEQALGEVDRLDERSDVFGLGAILCQILTGKPPYVATEAERVSYLASRGKLDDCYARIRACGADSELLDITIKCLAPEPDDRWRSAGVVAEQVTDYLQSVESRLRLAELGNVEQTARAEEAVRTAIEAQAKSRAERRARILQLSMAAVVIAFSIGGFITTSKFLSEQKRQTSLVASALDQKSDYLYVAHMQMIQQAWATGVVGRVRELLDQQVQQQDSEDRRTFEWFYFDRLCKQLESVPTMNYGDIITTVAVAPKNEFVVVAGNDQKIQVFDLSTNENIATLLGHNQKVIAIHITASGNTIVSSDFQQFHIWRRQNGEFIDIAESETSRPFQLRISEDGQFLLSMTDNQSIQVWDLNADQPTKRDVPFPAPVARYAWMHEGNQFVVALDDGTVRLCNATEAKEVATIAKAGDSAHAIVVADNDRYVAVANSMTIQVFELTNGNDAGSEDARSRDASLVHDIGRPDGEFRELIAVGDSFAVVTRQSVSIYNHESGLLTGRIVLGAETPESRIIASPNGDLIAMLGNDNLISTWDGITGGERATVRGHNNVVYTACFGSGKTIISGGRDETVRVTPPSVLEPAIELRGHREKIWSVAYSPSGSILASAGADSDIILWDSNTGRELHRLSDHTESVQFVTFSPSDNLLASASRDDTIRLWNVETRESVGECLGHTSDVNSLSFSRDGKHFVSGGDDGSVIVWDVSSREPVSRFDNSEGKIWAVAFADDDSVTFGGTSGHVSKWSYNTTRAPETLYQGGHNITSLRFSPDHKTLAFTTGDGAISLIEYSSGKMISRPTGHASDAMFTDFSPDGRTLVSAGADGKVRFWYLDVYEPTIRLDAHHDHIHCVAFSPDGSQVASGSWDRTIKLWSKDSN